MSARCSALLLCVLAAGCGASSRSAPATTAAAVTTQTTPPPPASFQPVAFETLDVGDRSPRGIAQGAHELHVATDPDWTAFWPTHSSAPKPAVDFSTHTVVGTYMGMVTGTGYRTRVINVDRDANSDDLHALVREFRPGSWRPQALFSSEPYHLVTCETAVSGQGTLSVDRQAELDFEEVAAGSDSAIGAGDPTYTGGLHVFRDAAAFAAFYARVQPRAVAPTIDFPREMAVVVLGPYVPSYGNSVQTLRLVHDDASDEIRVRWRVNGYRGGPAPPPATETPFQVLRVTPATGAIRDEQSAPLAVTALASGETSLYTGAAESLVVRDAATFAGLWSSRIGGRPPQVDFATEQVLMTFEGPASRLALSIPRADLLEDDEVAVTVHSRLVLGGLPPSAPYAVAKTPRTYGPVTFETIDVTPHP